MSDKKEQSSSESNENSTKDRRYNSQTENLIMAISTIIAIELSQNKTAKEIELITLILENVTVQLATIADLRVLNDGLSEEPPFLPFFPI